MLQAARHTIERVLGASVLKFVFGPVAMVAGGIATPLPAKMTLLTMGLVLVEGGHWAGQRALRREDAQHAITLLLRNTVDVIEASRPTTAERTLRANVMLPVSGELRIAYSTHGYSVEEHRLTWARGQGCVGVAWETAQTQYAPEDAELPVSIRDADRRSRPWNMTDEQIRMTAATVASVLSVPVTNRHRQVVGVFSLDDQKPINESSLASGDVQAAAEGVAQMLAGLLEKADFTSPDR